MYLGQVKEIVPCYYDKWLPGIGMVPARLGDVERILEAYECEACGYVANVLGRAEEPFYCKCQSLIGIE